MSSVASEAPMTRVVQALIDLAGTDAEALLRALVEVAEADEERFASIREADPLAQAKIRGLLARRELVQAEGGCLTGSDAADLLGLSRQAVDKRRQSGALLAVAIGRRGYLYPAWQFADGVSVRLPRVREALGDADPWSQIRFFVSPNSALAGRSPVVALRQGDDDEVERAARMWGTQGAP
ncbi:MAG: hypothetical protein R3F59_25375 [Myxococcota bacterium]